MRFRRNLLAHGTLPRSPFFFIATPEHIYSWGEHGHPREDDSPDLTVDAASALAPYLARSNQTSASIGGQALELVAPSWLTDLAGSAQSKSSTDPSMRWRADSGLIETLKTARFQMNST